jgi:hypothetical protein
MKAVAGALSVLFVCLAFAAGSCRAAEETTTSLFQKCLTARGKEYVEARDILLKRPEVEATLGAKVASDDTQPYARRIARMLLARMKHPEVFDEYREYVEGLRKHGNYRRGGWFSANLRMFAQRGPESRFAYETERTPTGESHWKKVEKYTDEQVRQGKARNAAAREALTEHVLKFSDSVSAYEQDELAGALWREFSNVLAPDDFTEEVLSDKTRPSVFRAMVADRLPREKREMKLATMLEAVLDDETDREDEYWGSIFYAFSFLADHGDQKTLAALTRAKPQVAWKQGLLDKAVEKIKERLSKPDDKNPAEGTAPEAPPPRPEP